MIDVVAPSGDLALAWGAGGGGGGERCPMAIANQTACLCSPLPGCASSPCLSAEGWRGRLPKGVRELQS